MEKRCMDISIWLSDKETDKLTYNEGAKIEVDYSTDVFSRNTSCTVTIYNMQLVDRTRLLSEASLSNLRAFRTKVMPIEIRIGRTTGGKRPNLLPRQIFAGALLTAEPIDGPDFGIKLTCGLSIIPMDSLIYEKKQITGSNKLSEQVKAIGEMLGMPVEFKPNEDEISKITGSSFEGDKGIYNLSALITWPQTMHRDKVYSFVKNGHFVVGLYGTQSLRTYPLKQVIGVPLLDSWGVKFTVLADEPIGLADWVRFELMERQKKFTNVSGDWIMIAVQYRLETRGTAWYASYSGYPPAK